MGVLALEDNALGHDDAGAPVGSEVFGHVVDEKNLAARGLHGKAVVRTDASLSAFMNGGLARITSAYSFQRSSLVSVSYSKMCGSTKPCRYIFTSESLTISGEMS